MSFNGSSTYINVPANPFFVCKNDFTFECWFYMSSAVNSCLLDQWSGAPSGNWQLYVLGSSRTLYFYYDGNNSITHQTAVPLNQWNHIAGTRSGTTVRVFLNGVTGTTTATSSAVIGQNATFWIGAQHSGGPILYPNGYIDEVRLTNGYARYTADFTPPTAAFPDQ